MQWGQRGPSSMLQALGSLRDAKSARSAMRIEIWILRLYSRWVSTRSYHHRMGTLSRLAQKRWRRGRSPVNATFAWFHICRTKIQQQSSLSCRQFGQASLGLLPAHWGLSELFPDTATSSCTRLPVGRENLKISSRWLRMWEGWFYRCEIIKHMTTSIAQLFTKTKSRPRENLLRCHYWSNWKAY